MQGDVSGSARTKDIVMLRTGKKNMKILFEQHGRFRTLLRALALTDRLKTAMTSAFQRHSRRASPVFMSISWRVGGGGFR
jgi:hypothetical protein